MFGKRYRLFTLLGVEIRLHASWFVLAVLFTWSLAVSYFPQIIPGLAQRAYWAMGITGTLGLFASIVMHELAHAVVARRNRVPIRGITLFIFGGVAEMEAEAPTARAELAVAIAGPLESIALGGLLLAVTAVSPGSPATVWSVVSYLGQINIVLAVFNLVPAFPLDGGRLLRAFLWQRRGDLASATSTASAVGAGFGLVLMTLGVAVFVFGGLVSGIWWFVLGMFLRVLAKSSYQQVLLREALAGEPVRRFMRDSPITVPSGSSVQELVDDYIYRYHHKLYPVFDGERLTGCVTVDHVRRVPRERWASTRVNEIASECSAANTISPETDALDALKLMRQTRSSRLLVAKGGKLKGVLTLKDLLAFFSLKMDLER